MGYELRRWLADRLPAGLSSGERLVALEIADQAGEQSRRAYGSELLETVVRRTGLADQKQLGKILGKLAASGLELRIPVRKDGQVVTDSRGRVLYACKGHALEFRIPTARECPALLVPQAGDLQSSPSEGSNERKAPPGGAQSSPARGTKLPQAGGPSPQSPQDSSSPDAPAPDIPPASQPKNERETDPLIYKLMADHGGTEQEIRTVLEQVRREGWAKNLVSWALSSTGSLDFKQRLTDLRRVDQRRASPSGLPAACGPCIEANPAAAFNPKFRRRAGDPCPDCHPDQIKDTAA